ncbi:MAG TPA: helix-turn-helix domain-containing protein, partial [Anaerolineales bacterium]|nr:helix-turn-helix domain-containing protein [Anaerolineales bacterium]
MNIQTNPSQSSEDYLRIEQAILYLENHYKDQPELGDVAANIGLSEYHFQRLFTRWAGVSPKRFLQFLTKEGAKDLLNRSENLLDTTHQVGLSSLGRLHDLFVTAEAVTPGEYKSHGAGVTIRYGIHPTPFGKCLIATTERGICHLSFVQTSEGDAIDQLVSDWKQATMIEDYRSTVQLIEPIFDLRYSHRGKPLNIHLRGTNFQLKVWEALLQIPVGDVTTYAGIASRIGN